MNCNFYAVFFRGFQWKISVYKRSRDIIDSLEQTRSRQRKSVKPFPRLKFFQTNERFQFLTMIECGIGTMDNHYCIAEVFAVDCFLHLAEFRDSGPRPLVESCNQCPGCLVTIKLCYVAKVLTELLANLVNIGTNHVNLFWPKTSWKFLEIPKLNPFLSGPYEKSGCLNDSTNFARKKKY